jgi:hypothetical protein
MIELHNSYYRPVSSAGEGVQIGERGLGVGERLNCGELGALSGAELRRGLDDYARRARGGYRPPLGALVTFIMGEPSALAGCFPLVNTLAASERAAFFELVGRLAVHPHLQVRLLDDGRRDVTADMPRDAAFLVAGQVAEIFFFRQDILGRLLATPRRIQLYTTPRAFADGGGVAGGCYSPATGSVLLLLARLYEGFYGPAPGAAPFLHEFGHMLDHFDASTAGAGASSGLLPGLRRSDGPIYTPAARELFLRGKRLELERYLRRYDGRASAGDPPPIGHPYVFQNDTEFIAGYLELFLRSPHAFARMNPDLYAGLSTLLRQDPRRAWAADFAFYIDENARFYASGQRPSRPGLTVP